MRAGTSSRWRDGWRTAVAAVVMISCTPVEEDLGRASLPEPEYAAAQAERRRVPSPEPSLEPVEPTEPGACYDVEPRARHEACIAGIAPRGDWARDRKGEARPAFGYICTFYSVHEQPRCREGHVDVVSRWRGGSKSCPQTMALYWAPSIGADWAEPTPVPGTDLELRSFPSDGTQFMFIRVNDYVVEAASCFARYKRLERTLIRWARRLHPEEYPATVADRR